MDRYVVVNGTTIVGGPYLWDGVSAWTPPDPGTLMLEAAALAVGCSYPPPPAPLDSDGDGVPDDQDAAPFDPTIQ